MKSLYSIVILSNDEGYIEVLAFDKGVDIVIPLELKQDGYKVVNQVHYSNYLLFQRQLNRIKKGNMCV